jgi:hypothetical protein
MMIWKELGKVLEVKMRCGWGMGDVVEIGLANRVSQGMISGALCVLWATLLRIGGIPSQRPIAPNEGANAGNISRVPFHNLPRQWLHHHTDLSSLASPLTCPFQR